MTSKLATTNRSIVFSLILLFAGGCATIPETVPAATQTTWSFDPDIESETRAIVSIGDDKTAVVSSLGEPKSQMKFKSDESIVVLFFSRNTIGPRRMKTVKTAKGLMNITDNVRYTYSIYVYLKDNKVVSVTFEKETQAAPAPFGSRLSPL